MHEPTSITSRARFPRRYGEQSTRVTLICCACVRFRDHEWRASGRSEVEIRYTLTETWTKVPGRRARDNKALQTDGASRRR